MSIVINFKRKCVLAFLVRALCFTDIGQIHSMVWEPTDGIYYMRRITSDTLL